MAYVRFEVEVEVNVLALVGLLSQLAQGKQESNEVDPDVYLLDRCDLVRRNEVLLFEAGLGDILLVLDDQQKNALRAAREEGLEWGERELTQLTLNAESLEILGNLGGYSRLMIVQAISMEQIFRRYLNVIYEVERLDAKLAELGVYMDPILEATGYQAPQPKSTTQCEGVSKKIPAPMVPPPPAQKPVPMS